MAFVRLIVHSHKSFSLSPKCLVGFLSKETGIRHCHSFEINKKVEARLKKADNLGDDYRIIYRAPFLTYCKVAYGLAGFSCSVFPTLFSTLIFTQGVGNYPVMLNNIEVIRSSFDLQVFAAGLAILIFQLSSVIFKYPYRIYQNTTDDTYVMIYQHFLPWKNEKVTLKAGELKKCDALFTWNDTLYKFRNRKAIIFDYKFHRPSDFEEMFISKEDKSSGKLSS